jgi:hypothetical protein
MDSKTQAIVLLGRRGYQLLVEHDYRDFGYEIPGL